MQTLTRVFRYGAVTVIVVAAALVTTGRAGATQRPGHIEAGGHPMAVASAGGCGHGPAPAASKPSC